MDLPPPLQTLVYEYLAGKYTIKDTTYYTDMYGYIYKTVKVGADILTRYYNRAGKLHRDRLPASIMRNDEYETLLFINNGKRTIINGYKAFNVWCDRFVFGHAGDCYIILYEEVPQVKEYMKSKQP